MGTRIKDAALVGSLGEGYKIPVSDGSNQPKTASVGQIGEFINQKYKLPELGSKVNSIILEPPFNGFIPKDVYDEELSTLLSCFKTFSIDSAVDMQALREMYLTYIAYANDNNKNYIFFEVRYKGSYYIISCKGISENEITNYSASFDDGTTVSFGLRWMLNYKGGSKNRDIRIYNIGFIESDLEYVLEKKVNSEDISLSYPFFGYVPKDFFEDDKFGLVQRFIKKIVVKNCPNTEILFQGYFIVFRFYATSKEKTIAFEFRHNGKYYTLYCRNLLENTLKDYEMILEDGTVITFSVMFPGVTIESNFNFDVRTLGITLSYLCLDGLYDVFLKKESATKAELESIYKELNGKINMIPSVGSSGGGGLMTQRTVLPSYGVIKITTKEDDTLDVWPVDKDTKHYCTYEYKDQFGAFNGYVVVKYQGTSSLNHIKKGFRLDFYEDSEYLIKKEIKFGGLIETNSFNLKGFYTDITTSRDLVICRLYKQAKETRNYESMYPWIKNAPIFNSATGTVDGFPCVLYVNGEFVGLQQLLLKKDAKNFNLYNNTDGMLYACDGTGWARYGENNDAYGSWASEFDNNDLTKKNKFFLDFIDFINSDRFTKDNCSEYMDVAEWIDYLIFVEAFYLYDNLTKNMLAYTNNFVKFIPFLYDLDLSFGNGYRAGGINQSPLLTEENVSWMYAFTEMFSEEMDARFKVLLDSGVLSYNNVEATFMELQKGIPYSAMMQDLEKYPREGYMTTTDMLSWYANRLGYLKERFHYNYN